jgi:chromosome partitioning protein
MFTIALIGQKGVTGKTTGAIGLAVEASRNGWDVVLVDLDQQATAGKTAATGTRVISIA